MIFSLTRSSDLHGNGFTGTVPSLANMPDLYQLFVALYFTHLSSLVAYNNLSGPVIFPLTFSFSPWSVPRWRSQTRRCYLEPNLALECPFPPGCEACTCGAAPSCASKCLYPGNWTPCSTATSSMTTPTPLFPTPSQNLILSSESSRTLSIATTNTSSASSSESSGNSLACLNDPNCFVQGCMIYPLFS